MNRAYVTFLAVAAIFALILCVNYVQMQSRITSHSKEVSSLQKELADLKEQNNTKYKVIEYDSPSGDYVKQYEGIPEDGVLAQSDKNAK